MRGPVKCAQPGCRADAAPDCWLCGVHEATYDTTAPRRAEFEAVRMDPNDDRDRWDEWYEDNL